MKCHNKVHFGFVDIYFFGRCIGNDKIPESGNNPLGMESSHFYFKTIDVYKKEVYGKNDVNRYDCKPELIIHNANDDDSTLKSKERKSDDLDSVHSVRSIDYTSKSLQPLNARQRSKCLKDSGVQIAKDQYWAEEGKCLVKIRHDRQKVGCKCGTANNCDSSKCECSQEGIPCLSDGSQFPCKCGPNCLNQFGKRAYSHLRIKYHYRHVLCRDLLRESNIDVRSTTSKHGGCQLCNEIDDITLHHIFKKPRPTKRKTINHKSTKLSSKPDKPKINTEDISNNVARPLLPSINYKELLLMCNASVNSFVDDTNKENLIAVSKMAMDVAKTNCSPENARGALVPISVHNNNSDPAHSGASRPFVSPNIEDVAVVLKKEMISESTKCDIAKAITENVHCGEYLSDNVLSAEFLIVPEKVSEEDRCVPSPLIACDTPGQGDSSISHLSNMIRSLYFESPFRCARRRRSSRFFYRQHVSSEDPRVTDYQDDKSNTEEMNVIDGGDSSIGEEMSLLIDGDGDQIYVCANV